VRVEFYQPSEKRRSCAWVAVRGRRTLVSGSVMAVGESIPHDVVQYVIEAATGYEHGFWGLVAKGATFKSTGRKRTKPGRAVIAAHRQELIDSGRLAGEQLASWHRGETTPVTAALTAAWEQWRDLAPGDRLVFEWPAAAGHTTHART
jgi:hypothetical protein